MFNQNYYGIIAIRENKNELYAMKKAVGAIFWHCTSFEDEEYRHRFCPKENNSWCKYKKYKATNKTTYKGIVNIPKNIHDIYNTTDIR